MIDIKQLRDYVIFPVLQYLHPEIPYSLAAEHLLLATAAQESHGEYLHQLGKGPAVGLWQMELATHDLVWRWATKNQTLYEKIAAIELPHFLGTHDAREMAGNLYYGCAMARVLYRSIPEALPKPFDVEDMARYWKRYYNTPKGKGTEEEFIRNWNRIVPALRTE